MEWMAKKGDVGKRNSLSSVNQQLKIDYQKLQECTTNAILEAQKEEEKYSLNKEWSKFLLSSLFIICIGAAVIGIILLCLSFVSQLNLLKTSQGLLPQIKAICLMGLQLIGAFWLVQTAVTTYFAIKELDKEQNRNYILMFSSNVVAFVALIVAIISLFR